MIRYNDVSGEPENSQRAEWAENAMLSFAESVGQAHSGQWDEDRDTVYSDFLADLMHLCDRDDIDFDDLVLRGKGHFNEEKANELEGDE